MKRKLLLSSVSLAMVSTVGAIVLAHCQIPCGIYNDPARFTLLKEHVTTIEKSMKEIEALRQKERPNCNQIVRWVNNKEAHADQLTEVVTFYFMAQRVKPADPNDRAAYAKYVKQLTLLHQMVFYAMKAKQTTDLENCAKLRSLIGQFEASYLAEHAHAAAGGTTSHSHP